MKKVRFKDLKIGEFFKRHKNGPVWQKAHDGTVQNITGCHAGTVDSVEYIKNVISVKVKITVK